MNESPLDILASLAKTTAEAVTYWTCIRIAFCTAVLLSFAFKGGWAGFVGVAVLHLLCLVYTYIAGAHASLKMVLDLAENLSAPGLKKEN